MKITVLNGSPKGQTSVTMQYVHYIQKVFPQHELEIIHIAQRIKKIERDEQVFQEIIDQVRDSDGVLWAFPLYVLLVHAHYKRFIELIWERGVQDAFADKYTATLSTSIHFYDHTAHNYMHAICDDLNMKYTGAFSADMQDLLEEGGPEKLTLFAESFAVIHDRGPRRIDGGAVAAANCARGDESDKQTGLLGRLARFATDLLALVPNPLALVRLGFANGTHFGRKLTYLLFVRAFDHDMRLIGARHGQTLGNLLVNFVGETNA